MRLQTTRPQGNKPLRTVSEIAEMLGITHQRLAHALKRDGAPAAAMTGASGGHSVVGKNRVWYEPRAVIVWYRGQHQEVNP